MEKGLRSFPCFIIKLVHFRYFISFLLALALYGVFNAHPPRVPCNLLSLEFSDAEKGKKRLDLAGALLAGLFRQLFRKLTLNVRKYLQLCLDKGSQFVVGTAIKSQVR